MRVFSMRWRRRVLACGGRACSFTTARTRRQDRPQVVPSLTWWNMGSCQLASGFTFVRAWRFIAQAIFMDRQIPITEKLLRFVWAAALFRLQKGAFSFSDSHGFNRHFRVNFKISRNKEIRQ